MRCAVRMQCWGQATELRRSLTAMNPGGAMCMCSIWRSPRPDGRSGNLAGAAAVACGGEMHCVARWGCIGGSKVNVPRLSWRSGSDLAQSGY